MNAFDYFKNSITTNYANFEGRARRSEYWFTYLFLFIANMVSSFIHPTLSIVVALGLLIPIIAAGVRRMHDVGKSGWFLLIPLYNLILLFTDSEPGTNQYGPNPKDGGDVVTDQLV